MVAILDQSKNAELDAASAARAKFPDTMAPDFSLKIENRRLDESVRDLIQSVEYESVDGMADVMKIVINDTFDKSARLPIRDSKLFMPGNNIALFIGYGSKLRHVGSAVVRRVRPIFPANSAPTMEIVAYTADSLMMATGPEPLKETKKLKKGGTRIKNSKAGRRWTDAKYSDAVKDRCDVYGFDGDIDVTPEPPTEFIQKANMTDYDFIKGLANLTGFIFWVDGDSALGWTLHFKDPSKLHQGDLQDKQYTFKYGDDDYSTLLTFEPELAINDAITKLLVQTKDPVSGRILQAKIEEENDNSPDTKVDPGNVNPDNRTNGGDVVDKSLDQRSGLDLMGNGLTGPLTTASDIKLFVEDFSFDVRCNRRFRNEAELAAWAAQWFRRNRENFLLSRGSLIGIEDLRARQQHKLVGLGTAWDGLYYFSRVRHTLSAGNGYTCDFSARKLVPELPPVTSSTDVQIEQLLLGNS
jgi:phage protein D